MGVNAFREQNEIAPPILAIDPEIEPEQLARLAAFRAARNSERTERARARLQADAREDRNLMPAMIEAVTEGATLGEIVKSLKEIYGEHRPGD